jgi:hypothetical protein
MLMSALLREPAYAARVNDAPSREPFRVPSVLALQAKLEAAWTRGRDRDGAAHYTGAFLTPSLVGTSAFIGSSEVATMLRESSIPVQHVAFHAFDDPNLEQLLSSEEFALVSVARSRAAEELRRTGGRSPSELLTGRSQSPQSAAERLFLYRRHAALLFWLFRLFSVRVPYDERVHWERERDSGAGAGAGAGAAGDGLKHLRFLGDPLAPTPYLLYLQHDGHARTLAGFEITVADSALNPAQSRLDSFLSVKRSRVNDEPYDVISGDMVLTLLLLDPSVSRPDIEGKLRAGAGWQPLVKRGLHTMRHAHYEIVWVPHPTDPLSAQASRGGPPKRLFSGLNR